MKTQRFLLIVVISLILLVAINIVISVRQPQQKQVDYDNTEPNDTAFAVERVKSPEERARMENYLAEYQKGQKVVKTIIGSSGEFIDCIDLYTQPGVRMNKIERNEIQFAPKTWQEFIKGDSIVQPAEIETPDTSASFDNGNINKVRNTRRFFQERSWLYIPALRRWRRFVCRT